MEIMIDIIGIILMCLPIMIVMWLGFGVLIRMENEHKEWKKKNNMK